jgi:hypothetical protein
MSSVRVGCGNGLARQVFNTLKRGTIVTPLGIDVNDTQLVCSTNWSYRTRDMYRTRPETSGDDRDHHHIHFPAPRNWINPPLKVRGQATRKPKAV